ncbi:MAG TPA: hypothetical protein VJS67_11025 [Pseudonocardiaceae bacterium]|nr:hypothetical protein [Pseudonocardiaceae bacterium]
MFKVRWRWACAGGPWSLLSWRSGEVAVLVGTATVLLPRGLRGGVHDGPALRLADAVTVDLGKVHAPSLAWDPGSKRLYAEWMHDSATPGPYGGQLGVP